MSRNIYLLLLIISMNFQPVHAEPQSVQIKTDLAFFSEKFLGVIDRHRYSNNGKLKLDVKYDTNISSSQITLNYDEYNKFTLDNSYLQYTSGIATFGVGIVNRHWSFSDKTSLILSHNARPIKSIYLKLNDEFKYDWMSSKANWSLDVFNGLTEGSLNGGKSMLFGIRAILSPADGLDFELIQTSQWGGNGYSSGISSLGTVLFFDSNNGSNSNINKMAGFGISYLVPHNIMPLRIYGQSIGEDEAGNLPSCSTYLAGFEWTNTKIKYPIIVGVETIDTRVDRTAHGYCGPNTMYNNGTYSYTNYGKTIGASIDTEGTSLGIYLRSQISQKLNIEFATKSVVINDDNWAGHRLSSKRQSGLINSFGGSWIKNNMSFSGNIYYQGFNLDKASIHSGYGVSFLSSIKF
jgi:hypothetical protein